MIVEIQGLVDQYLVWLRDKTALRQVNEWIEITTPFLDRHNDYIQIYAKKANGGFILTDDGYIVEDLNLSGCSLDPPKRQQLLKITLAGFGVELNEKTKALQVRTSPEKFSLRKHSLIQAMLAVNDLFYLASPTITSFFLEDVETWLNLNSVRFTPRVKFTGKSGYDHLFDFVIPKSKTKPERILRAFNRPGRDTAEAMVFSWLDTREVRPSDSRAYALLNDSERPVPSGVREALKSYEVEPVEWSLRDRYREELAA